MSNFHKNLKSLRSKSGFTQKEMALLVNIKPRQWQRYESGDSEPRLDTFISIATFFNVSLDKLAGYKLPNVDFPTTKTHKIITVSLKDSEGSILTASSLVRIEDENNEIQKLTKMLSDKKN